MQGPQALPPLRTRIYIDGYNFYYGCLKGTPYKWLDLLPLFEQQILPSILVTDAVGQPRSFALLSSPSLKLFTAPILETVAKAPDSVSSQSQYHKALRLLHPEQIELIQGYYAVQRVWVKEVDEKQPSKWPRHCQEVQIWKVEEKQSDVNLALQAYHDAITGQIDQAVIVTNDTDIAPALTMIRSHTPVLIGLVVPTRDAARRPNQALVERVHWTRTHITATELAACQLPRVIPDTRRPATKPVSWYAQPELLQEVIDLARPILGNRAQVFQWLDTPFARLDGQRPIELMETEAGAQRVLAYIQDYIASVVHTTRPALDPP